MKFSIFPRPPGVVAFEKNLKKFKEIERRFPWIWGVSQRWRHLGRGFCPIRIRDDLVEMKAALLSLPDKETRVFVFVADRCMDSNLHPIDPKPGDKTWLELINRDHVFNGDCCIRAVAVLKARNGRFDLDPTLSIFTANNEKQDMPAWWFSSGGATCSAD